MLSNFRKLNKGEKELMDKQYNRNRTTVLESGVRATFKYAKAVTPIYTKLQNSLSVSYQVGDPVTVCIIKNGSKKVAGVAKRVRYAPMEDQFSEEKGRVISFSHAIRTFLEEV